MRNLSFLVSLLIIPSLLIAQRGNTPSNSAGNSTDVAITTIIAPSVPKKFTLFGEKVPLENVDIHDRFDRELIINTYMQGSTLQILKRMGRWFPMIEERLKVNGVPDDFKYLCVAESALSEARSGVGASGFWQFMKGTAPSYGLEVNDNVDERYNVYKATDAACTYLKQAYARLGNWTAAAASYNCGMGGYNKAATEQGTYNFYDLWLPDETMRYIFRIAALKYILDNPVQSGYVIKSSDLYKPYSVKKIPVTTSIPNLIQWAQDNGTTYKMVRTLNPWLRDRSLKNSSGKYYEILIPRD